MVHHIKSFGTCRGMHLNQVPSGAGAQAWVTHPVKILATYLPSSFQSGFVFSASWKLPKFKKILVIGWIHSGFMGYLNETVFIEKWILITSLQCCECISAACGRASRALSRNRISMYVSILIVNSRLPQEKEALYGNIPLGLIFCMVFHCRECT